LCACSTEVEEKKVTEEMTTFAMKGFNQLFVGLDMADLATISALALGRTSDLDGAAGGRR